MISQPGRKDRPEKAAIWPRRAKCGAENIHTVHECNNLGGPVILDRMTVAWIIVATWIIGLRLIALIRAWIRRNETSRH